MTISPLFPDLSLHRSKHDLPKRLYKQLSPNNPNVKIHFFKTMELMYKRQLVTLIRDDPSIKIRANSTWLKAFEMLEKRGVHLGISVTEVAQTLSITPGAAKRAMLKAEELIYAHFGLNICFVDNNGMWRLATEIEVACKYAAALKGISTYARRLNMYRPLAAEQGKRISTLSIPLFELPEGNNDPTKN